MTKPTPAPTELHAAADAVLTVLFIVAICAPGLAHLFTTDDPSAVKSENRSPAPPPGRPRTLEDLAAFPARFESYFDDAFRFRTALVRGHNLVKLFLLQTSPSEGFLVGEDGWLFCTVNDTVAQHRGLRPRSEAELDGILATIRRRTVWLASRGATYAVIVAPDKSSIYPERLPAWLQAPPVGPVPLDQLVARAHETGETSLVDVRDALRARRDERLVYYPYGTHWNPLGAYYAYRELFERLARSDPGVTPFPIDRYDVAPIRELADSWGLSTHMEEELIQDSFRVELVGGSVIEPRPGAWKPELRRVWEQQDASLPTAIVLADSFGRNILPFILPHFSRTLEVHGYDFDTDMIRVFQPDYVIQVVVERCVPSSGFRVSEIERACFEPAAAGPDPIAALAGTYRNPVLGTVDVKRRGDGLVARYGEFELALVREAPHLFVSSDRERPMSVVFERDSVGGPPHLTAITPSNLMVMTFAREASPGSESDDAALAGTYEAARVRWHVASTGAGLVLFTQRGEYLGTLHRSGPGAFSLMRKRAVGRIRFGPPSGAPSWMDLDLEGPISARASRVTGGPR